MKKVVHAMPAFMDELEKISFQMPNMAQAGNWAKQVPGRVGAWAKQAPGQAVNAIKNAPSWANKQFIGGSRNIGSAAAALKTPGKSLAKGWHASWTSAHPAFKGLMALGLLQGAHSVKQREDPTGMGRSRLHRGLQFAGEQLGGLIGAPYGLAGGMAASMVGSKAGNLAGRAVDRVRGYRAQQQPPHLPPPPQGMQG